MASLLSLSWCRRGIDKFGDWQSCAGIGLKYRRYQRNMLLLTKIINRIALAKIAIKRGVAAWLMLTRRGAK